MNSDSERALYIHSKYNDLLEPNSLIYEDKNCIGCNGTGQKIIMNDKSKFTFIYRSTLCLTFISILNILSLIFLGISYFIMYRKLEVLLLFIFTCLIYIIIIGFYINFSSCLILDENSVKIIKRKLLYKTTIIYDKFELDRIELEYKFCAKGEGPSHYYDFNLLLTSGKKEMIYKLSTNNDKVNRKDFDALLNIVNLYIGAS